MSNQPPSPTYTPPSMERSQIQSSGAPGSPTFKSLPRDSDDFEEKPAKRARGLDAETVPLEADAVVGVPLEADAVVGVPLETDVVVGVPPKAEAAVTTPLEPPKPRSFLQDLLTNQAQHYEVMKGDAASSSHKPIVLQDDIDSLRKLREDIETRISDWISGCQFHEYLEDHMHHEIELRLGTRSGTSGFATGVMGNSKFSSGISKSDFDKIFDRLSLNPDFDSRDASSIEYCYDVDGNQTIKLSVDPQSKQVVRAQSKEKLRSFDIPPPPRWDFNYILRIAEARELDYECPAELHQGWASVRTKNRTNFAHREYPNWTVDLTAVSLEEYYSQPGSDVLLPKVTDRYELEFELAESAAALQKWQDHGFVSLITTELYWLMLLLLHPSAYEKLKSQPDPTKQDKFSDLRLVQVNDPAELRSLQQALWSQVPNQQNARFPKLNFPGAMPVAFSRRHFATIQNPNNRYFVSEKTDGVRYILFIHQQRSFFVNRKNDFFEVSHTFPQLAQALWPHGAVIDGELTRNLSNAKPFFMIFDLLSINGNPLHGITLGKRLEIIRDQVVTPYRQAVTSNIVPENHPFVMIAKLFFPRDKIKTIFASISRNEENERVYRDPDGKRHHLTDGIIFTPDDLYHPFGNHNLFKWKYPDLLSIDFVVRESEKSNSNLISVFCGGAGSSLIFCRDASFAAKQTAQLIEHIRAKHEEANRRGLGMDHPSRNVVAECVYNTDAGQWEFHLIRNDKHQPNHISVVMDTMEAVAENITEHELIYRTLRPEMHDDWIQKTRTLLSQALRV